MVDVMGDVKYEMFNGSGGKTRDKLSWMMAERCI